MALVTGLRAVPAESAYERELRQLLEQRDRDVTAETQRINRVYRAALEKLLLRATQNRDYDASAKINEEIRKVAEPTANPMAPASAGAEGPLADRIQQLLTSSVWIHGGQFHYVFGKDGSVTVKEPHPKGHYKINGATGVVTFTWERNQFPGEGIRFDAATGKFTHIKDGQPFVPAP
jgi:hypothetical protein